MTETTKAGRMSLYAGKPITEVLECLGKEYDENRSGRINTVCERYLLIVNDEIRRIDFSRAEWMAILDANNGMTISTGFREGDTMMWANVEDSSKLDEKWGIDRRALVKKMKSLSTAGKVAMREAADRFWSMGDSIDTDEALAQSGIELRHQERKVR